MPVRSDILLDPWPLLSYPDVAGTRYLLHMGLQAVGKAHRDGMVDWQYRLPQAGVLFF